MEITQSWAEKYVFLIMFWPDLSTNLSKSKYSFPSPKPLWAISRFWFSVLIFRTSTINSWNVLNITIWLPKLEVNLLSSVSFLFFFLMGLNNFLFGDIAILGFPGGANGKELACQCRRRKRRRLHLWVGKIPQRKAWQSTALFSPGESHGQRSLVGSQRIGHAWATDHAYTKYKYISLKQTNFCKDWVCNSEWES